MYTIDKAAFGAFVAQLRRERGLTQKELAGQLHITDKAVSKWETGGSLPDTALLIPLSEALGVSVTELLLCRRESPRAPLESEQVEQLLRALLRYPDTAPERAFRRRGPWWALYGLCLAAGLAALSVGAGLGLDQQALWTPLLLGALFGAYFCFFVPLRLPEAYDRVSLSLFQDGFFRMNLPGVSFNNRNWPQVIRACRVWACAAMAGLPLLGLGLGALAPALWRAIQIWVVLLLTLGGLFLPVYRAARRRQ